MKKAILSLTICLLFSIGFVNSQTTINYSESTEVFANPDRGLQKYSITNNSYNTIANYSSLSKSTLEGWRTSSDKVTVIFRYFLMNSYLDKDISQIYLDNIQKDFDIIRDAGLKCIVRFSYSNGQSTAPQQPVKSRILSHINQLAPILEANKDIIFSHQAGFLGTWGEWYYTNSTEFGTDGSVSSAQWANRKEIIDAMLVGTPSSIPIQVRYPKVKKNMYGNSQLTPGKAYENTPAARIGFYNDAFLNRWGDMGTYSISGENTSPVGSADYTYLSNETQYTPMTGETNGLNPPRTAGTNALNEMDLTNWTTLNRDYHKDVINGWISSGHYPDILRKLGYRFVLKKGIYNKVDDQLSLDITIENVGFARIFKQRNAFLILKNNSTNQVYSYLIDSDPRTWENEANITQTVNISNLPQGSYDSYLNLPDYNEQLALRSEYSIRLANENVWDEATGYNKLNYSFDVIIDPTCPDVDVVIDGNNTEWSALPVYAENGSQILKIYDNEEYVAFMFDGNIAHNYQLYIDTDQDVSTGYLGHSWTNMGAEYRIENGKLTRYTGSGNDWSWEQLGNVSAVNQNGIIELKIDREYFTKDVLMAGMRILDSDWLVTSTLPSIAESHTYEFCTLLSNIFVPNKNGKHYNTLAIYPNPATNFVNILLDESMGFQQLIQVFSVNGQLVLSKSSSNNHLNGAIPLNISSLAEGVYSVVMKSEKTIKTGKIVKVNN